MAERIVIFLHVPKAAGSTLNAIFARQWPAKSIVRVGGQSREQTHARIAAAPHARIITGHYPFGLHTALPGPATYLTILREPIRRFLSHCQYAEQLPGHHLHEALSSGALNLRDAAQRLANLQTRYLAGDTAPATAGTADESTLAAAKANLERHFTVAGLTEQFDETVVLLQRRMGWKLRPFSNVNVTKRPHDASAPGAEDLAAIRAAHQLDLALYEWARERFESAITAEGASFSHEVARLRRRNRRHAWLRSLVQRS